MNYVELLNQCWQRHLANDGKGPTVISTFAGCGGSSLGYLMAGFQELLAIEWDQKAVETFKANFPGVPVYHGDICKLSVDECLSLAGVKSGELDVLDGSPPCQGFSIGGKREYKDDRNQLYKEYLRLLIGLKPKVFVMENVSGMVKGVMKNIWLEIMDSLESAGYNVKCKMMNAANYNVPQQRMRLLFIGIRNDIKKEISYPNSSKEIITVKKAWWNLSIKDRKKLPPIIEKIYKATPKGLSLEVGAMRVLKKKEYFTSRRLCWNKPSNTASKQIGSGIYHPDIPAIITISELKRLGSFPDNFIVIGPKYQQWSQIGNSVPPLMMMAIAEHIKTYLLPKGEKV